MADRRFAVVVRVGTPGQPVFQLRRGEEGLSVFDPDAVDPPLTDDELLDAFRPGSVLLFRTADQIAALGLEVVPTDGADTLPLRLRLAHAEVRPGAGNDPAGVQDGLEGIGVIDVDREDGRTGRHAGPARSDRRVPGPARSPPL